MASTKQNVVPGLPGQALVPTGRTPAREPDSALRVLIVDNDASHAETIAESLTSAGARGRYECTVAFSGTGGARLMEQETFDVIITDLVMNDLDGLEILAKAKADLPDSEVILVTGHGSVPSAVNAMHQGAFYYLLKPLDLKQLRAVVERAADSIRLRRANVELHRRLDEKFGFEGLIGSSPAMLRVIDQLRRIAPTSARVLIQGATGTGKELVAQAIHQNSKRKNKPFVGLNCASLSGTILESELFGHIKGAFTDASSDRVGWFEKAHGGTLFLDEVGDMPISTQIKLLRVIEASEIVRVGSNEPIKVDVRILSATNRNLEEAMAAGSFREDLYHRLKVVTIRLPALAERGPDIPLLIEHFVRQYAKTYEKPVKSVSTAAKRRLIMYDWPGNVRQLSNVIESMVALDGDGILDLDDLPEELAEQPAAALTGPTASGAATSLSNLAGRPLSEVERLVIAETLKLTGGNREEAATTLGIGERTLYRKIKEYGL